MQPLKAHVKNGRLVLDEPTDLPDGEVIYLHPIEAEVGAGDGFDNDERAALLGGGEKHGQGSAIIRGGQAAGIAVRQHSLPFLNQRGTGLANGAAHSAIFFFDGARLLQEQAAELLRR